MPSAFAPTQQYTTIPRLISNRLFQMKPMKSIRMFITLIVFGMILSSASSCSLWHQIFKPKTGCPSNGKNVGAERLMSNEKVKKARKFRA